MKIEMKKTLDMPNTHIPDGAEVIGKVTKRGPGGPYTLALLGGKLVEINAGGKSNIYKRYYGGPRHPYSLRKVHTAIIRAILAEFCDDQKDLAKASGYSIDTVKSWSSGRRVPPFGVIKLILMHYGIIGK